MKRKRYAVSIIAVGLIAAILCGCSPNQDRVQEALDKLENIDSISAKVSLVIDSMSLHFDFISTDEGMSMHMSTDVSTVNGQENMDVDMYVAGDKVYMYYPQLTSQFIDVTSTYQPSADHQIGINTETFDFDLGSTRFESDDTTIKFNGSETHVLMVLVLLDDQRLNDMIQNLLVQQSAGLSTYTGENLVSAEDIYDDMEIESAEYAFFIDDDNNLIRVYINAVLSHNAAQYMQYDIKMVYYIIDTGDDVTLDLPDIREDNVISYEALMAMMEG